jgi:L-lactate dehydrogenase complex protein LldG
MKSNMNNNESQFIARVRAALGHEPYKKRGWSALDFKHCDIQGDQLLAKIRNRTSHEKQKLLTDLVEQSQPLNLKVILSKDAAAVTYDIIKIIQEKQPEWGRSKQVMAWKHPLIESLDLVAALKKENIHVPVNYAELIWNPQNGESPESGREKIRHCISGSFIGVTSADYCLAETATLVMKTRPGQARAVSLVPSIHIAVIEIDRIIANLKELYALISLDDSMPEGLTNCMTFITGPSKTADIEAVMVHGAHGPRELYLFVITGDA